MNSRPNILLLFCDQLRRNALGIAGDPNVSTPHIDALAGSGVRFTRANSTCPICTPFRFSLLTGEYAHSRLVPAGPWRMSPAERTLGDEFSEAGYDTTYIGKWHLYGEHGVESAGRRATTTIVPASHRHGWKKWLGFELCNDHFNTCYFEDDDPTPHPLGKYQTDGLFDLAIDHLGRRSADADPFFCVLSVEPPHFPYEAPAPLEEQWLAREIQYPPNFLKEDRFPAPGAKVTEREIPDQYRQNRIYYAMTQNLDDNVGRMMRFLESSGMAENTVVLFFSDHGEMGGAHNIHAYRKSGPFEESVGIPLIVSDPRLPGRAGAVIDDPASTEDFYPTLLGLAGLTPRDPKPGIDLAPLVRGEIDRLPREGVMLEYAFGRPGAEYYERTWRAFRSRRFKYTVIGDALGCEPWQFFDLESDPYEMNNLIDDPSSLAEIQRHHDLLRQRIINTNDHFVLSPLWGQDGVNGGPEVSA